MSVLTTSEMYYYTIVIGIPMPLQVHISNRLCLYQHVYSMHQSYIMSLWASICRAFVIIIDTYCPLHHPCHPHRGPRHRGNKLQAGGSCIFTNNCMIQNPVVILPHDTSQGRLEVQGIAEEGSMYTCIRNRNTYIQ